MRPDQRWFPTNRAARAAWFDNFAKVFEEVAIGLGFTQADIDSVKADNAVVQFLATAILLNKTSMKTLTALQRTLLSGKRSQNVPQFPPPPVLVPPPIVPPGIFERLELLVRRMRVMNAYNAVIGTRLRIIPNNPSRATPVDYKASFRLLPSTEPYSLSLNVLMRHLKMWSAEILREGATEWENLGRYDIAKMVIPVKPTNPGKPEIVKVRVRMRKHNKDIGMYSDIQVATLTP